MAKEYIVTLTSEEREVLLALTKRGKLAARQLMRVHILLQADAGVRDEAIAHALHAGMATVERVRRIGERASLECKIAAWESRRNEAQAKVNWRFTTKHARAKLQRLYPSKSVR